MGLVKRKCLCDNPTCAKCLGVNCEDDGCAIHSVKDKIRFKERIMDNLKDKSKIIKLIKEIERLKNLI